MISGKFYFVCLVLLFTSGYQGRAQADSETVSASIIISSGLVKPLLRLVEGTKEIENGKLDISIEASTRDEVGQLTDAFNMMVGGLLRLNLGPCTMIVADTSEATASRLEDMYNSIAEIHKDRWSADRHRFISEVASNEPIPSFVERLVQHTAASE